MIHRSNRSASLTGILLIVAAGAAAATASAEVTVSPMFGDHMVLQRGIKIPVWGKADAGEKVTVTLADQSQTATADLAGRWRLTFAPIADAVAEPALTM